MGRIENRSYSEVISLDTFKERYEYLRLTGDVGEITFGGHRLLNQSFYRSKEWKSIRDQVIIRDNCCDLAMDGHEIYSKPIIHHINPISIDDIRNKSKWLYDLDNLILVSYQTHNAIHYGSYDSIFMNEFKERTPGDTRLW